MALQKFGDYDYAQNGVVIVTFAIQKRHLNNEYHHRRRPRRTGGDGPKKFEVGDGPCIRPPNILRSSVAGCARKYEKSKKKGVTKELFSEKEDFLVKKGSYTTFHRVTIWKI